MRILCTADLHIGWTSTQLPPSVDPARFSCAAAWSRVVDAALQQRVHALVIGGDLVDRSNKRYEAFGALETGLKRLLNAGIATFAVSGNHDFDVLPPIATHLGRYGFRLLGANGAWEETNLSGDGEEPVRVMGRCFTDRHETSSPLASFPGIRDNIPTLVLLHGQIGAAGGSYAPLATDEMDAHGAAMWVVGHTHRAELLVTGTGATALTPGSPQALDPGEPGFHGAWVVEFRNGRAETPVLVPLSTAAYVGIEVDVDGVESDYECQTLLRDRIADDCASMREECSAGVPPAVVCVRAELHGRTVLHRQIPHLLSQLMERQAAEFGDGVWLESSDNATLPPVDLRALAEGGDALSAPARLLLSIDADRADIDFPDLVRKAEEAMARDYRAGEFAGISYSKTCDELDAPPDRAMALAHLKSECANLLSALLAQREGS